MESLRLWLRSGRREYLHAAEDGRSVRLDPRRVSDSPAPDATPQFYPYAGALCVQDRSAYGLYLGAADSTASGSLCSSSPQCRADKQGDFDNREVPAIMSRAVATSRQGAFLTQDATGRHLRPNSSCLLPSRSGVSTRGGLCTATQWAAERVPRAGRLDVLPPRNFERGIRWARAGVFGERQLVNLLPRTLFVGYALCVRARRNGQASSLVVNPPRSPMLLDRMPYGRSTAGQCANDDGVDSCLH